MLPSEYVIKVNERVVLMMPKQLVIILLNTITLLIQFNYTTNPITNITDSFSDIINPTHLWCQ